MYVNLTLVKPPEMYLIQQCLVLKWIGLMLFLVVSKVKSNLKILLKSPCRLLCRPRAEVERKLPSSRLLLMQE